MKNKIWRDEIDATLDDAARRYAADRYRFEVRQRLPSGERRFSPGAWSDFAEMGWMGVSTSEECGGLGLRVASICLLAEVAGSSLVTEPLTSAGVLAPHLLARHGSDVQREEVLPRLLRGELRVACLLDAGAFRAQGGRLSGHKAGAIDADIAQCFIVRANDGLWLVDAQAQGVTRKRFPLLDGRGAASITLENATATRLGGDDPCDVQQALLLASLATAADSHGAMTAAFDLTLEYLKTRRQFGAPLGANQALQHRAVDMYIALAESRAVLDQAIESLQAASAQAARDVHAAKSLVCDSARRVTQEAVQLHGGIGVTDEYAVSHYLRRVRVNEQLWGSAEQHFLAFAAAPVPSEHQ